METKDINQEVLNELQKIRIDINFIKENLADGELSDWAKEELVESRKIPESDCISHEEVKEMILQK